jgi:hypothetical protein
MASKKTGAKASGAKPKTSPRAAGPAKGRTPPSVSPLRGTAVEDWVRNKATGWQVQVVERLLSVARKAAPGATLSIKWAQPVLEKNGPVAFIKVAKAHVTFGFWRGAELEDPKGLLEGGAMMKHLKIASPEVVDETLIAQLVRQAVALNQSKGDPTARSRAKT